ncbi:exported hypothetical protein [Desulfamplus magnetovallimortis]|uniref:Uncharacterized protein n=1 Tax=Desulfamplus magnetovallimortis TaxID=1246637 RepID=A0A1W1HFJ6_9BACT|nr:hypothetical protein [Desulfamplus magnetovallimortis]SLM31206.1 exported hypothetical protein [Desulfamplus magnetovallimortis]
MKFKNCLLFSIFTWLYFISLQICLAEEMTVDDQGDVGLQPSIAVDSNNLPHISYYDITNNSVKYAKRTSSGSWLTELVDNVAQIYEFKLDVRVFL